MKVLVQQPSTGLFYKASHTWVADPKEALDFRDSLQAFDFCASSTKMDAQICLFSAEPHATMFIAPEKGQGLQAAL